MDYESTILFSERCFFYLSFGCCKVQHYKYSDDMDKGMVSAHGQRHLEMQNGGHLLMANMV